MKRLHIFRAGRRTTRKGETITFTEADLVASAAAYDPAKHEAPLVIGHPKTDTPAHGWVESLTASAADLFATPRQVAVEFAEGVKAGRHKKISAAFYAPDHPDNPVPGVYYLRHVGFLGAQPPSVKGLQPVEFADAGDDLVEVEFAEFGDWSDGAVGRALRQMREWLIGKFGLEEADKALPAWTADALIEASVTPDPDPRTASFAENHTAGPRHQEHPTMTPEQIEAERQRLAAEKAARDAEFAEREAKLKARETATAEAEARQARAEAVEFAEQLVKEGRLPPALQSRVVELLHATRGVSTEIEFAEGDATVKAAPRAALEDLLKALPVTIEYAERAGKDQREPANKGSAQKLADAALAFQETERKAGRVISVAQAMDYVTQQASA